MDKYSKTRYNRAPTISKGRTRFDLSHSILTTCNTGDWFPVFAEPVYPGETHDLKKLASLVRLETSLHQTMDNAYIEFDFFFVPTRIVWSDFEKFLGASDDAWAQTQTYTIPQINLNFGGSVNPGSLLNHLALPAGSYGYTNNTEFLTIDAIPLRSTFQIYNDWFRDENYDSIVAFSKNSSPVGIGTGYTFNGNYVRPNTDCLKVNRFKDVFSTALPAPQKGQEITFGIGGIAPLIADGAPYTIPLTSNAYPVSLAGSTGMVHSGYLKTDGNDELFIEPDSSDASASAQPVTRTNLKADLSNATLVTINQLRLAIAAQAIKERDARGGTRYKEKIYSTWGVNAQDLEIDRSEFLGGKRIPVSMMEVLQTSETGTTVLGTDAGHSKTIDLSEGFIKSFTQYGWIIGVCFIRTARSYSQGIDRKFRSISYYDMYDPMMDNIGEVAVEKSELYALNTADATHVAEARKAWAYQEAWYFLKERTNRFSGFFQPGITNTLDSWHYGDNYTDYPSMSAAWLKEGASNVDRTIAVQSSAAFQWTLNISFEYYVTRVMGKYSIPNTFGF